MIKLLHAISGLILFSAHTLFLARALYMVRRHSKPERIDRLFRLLSLLFLPITIATGFLLLIKSNGTSFPHPLLGILPLASIPLVNLLRIIFRKKKEAPWLLPVLNFLLILSALITGFIF
jgi:cytochrome bd-type quinol oxidase subunit 2